MIINMKETLADTISGKKILAAYAENSYTKTETDEILNTLGGVEVVPLDQSTEEPIVEKPNEKMLYLTENEDSESYSQWIYKNSTWTKLKLYAEDVEYDEDITPDEIEDTVATVNELKKDLDTKISTNYPPALVTQSLGNIADNLDWQPNNGGLLYGSLFNVPLRHKIYQYNPDNNTEDALTTLLGVYINQGPQQGQGPNCKVIFGIYEYQPDYIETDPQTGEITQRGRTVALCDTGPVEIKSVGYHEFPIKNVNNDNTTESIDMKTDCQYYASIFFSQGEGSNAPFRIAATNGYNPQMNYVNPQFALFSTNNIKASMYEGQQTYTENLSFNDFGFGWVYDNYPAKGTWHKVSLQEAYNAPRFYMQIRNVKNWTPPPEPVPPEPLSTYYVLEAKWTDNNNENFVFGDYYVNGDSIKGDSTIMSEAWKQTNYDGDFSTQVSNYVNGFQDHCHGIRFTLMLENKPNSIGWFTNQYYAHSKSFVATVYEVTNNGETWTSIGTLNDTQQQNATYTINCS